MPYITKEQRFKYNVINAHDFESPGNLNYAITKQCLSYLTEKGESYKTYNDIIGVLECCKMELYRRKIAHYENLKLTENGDVYV